ncbi:unnamed protein product [Discosporangium mesarthrocarpum]
MLFTLLTVLSSWRCDLGFSTPARIGSPKHGYGTESVILQRRNSGWRRGGAQDALGLLWGKRDSTDATRLVAELGFDVVPPDSSARRIKSRYHEGEDSPSLDFLDDASFSVPFDLLLAFEREGHTVSRGLFTEEEAVALGPSVQRGFEEHEKLALRQKVSVCFGDHHLRGDETTQELLSLLRSLPADKVPFLQVFNLYRKAGPHQETVKRLVLSKRLASVAAQLLGCKRWDLDPQDRPRL